MVQVGTTREGLVATVRNVTQLLPDSTTQRSAILSDILKASEIGDVEQLLVDDEDFSAWLAFDPSDESRGVHFFSAALKAADVLRDGDATNVLSFRICEALFPEWGNPPDTEGISQVLSDLPYNLRVLVLSRTGTLGVLFNRLPPELEPLAVASDIQRQRTENKGRDPSDWSLELNLDARHGFQAATREAAEHLCRAMAAVSTMATADESLLATLGCTLTDLEYLSLDHITTSRATNELVSANLCRLLSSLPSLRKVSMAFTRLTDWGSVSQALAALPALSFLDIEGSNFDGLLRVDREWPTLEVLFLSRPEEVTKGFSSTTAVLSSVAPALRSARIEVDFSLESILCGSQSTSLFKWFKVPHLEELEIHGHFDKADCAELALSLRAMHSLRSLELTYCDMSMSTVAKGMAGLTRLEFFTADVKMGVEDARVLAEQFCHFGGLKMLDMKGLAHEPFCVLAAQLGQLPELRFLELSASDIRDEGVCALTEHFSKLQQLSALGLSGCRIGDSGARAISQSLEKLTSLDTLFFVDNKCGKEWQDSLQRGLALSL